MFGVNLFSNSSRQPIIQTEAIMVSIEQPEVRKNVFYFINKSLSAGRSAFEKTFGKLVGMLILPASLLYQKDTNYYEEVKHSCDSNNKSLLSTNDVHCTFKNYKITSNIDTLENCVLDTMEISPKSGDKKDFVHIINFLGNAEIYELSVRDKIEDTISNNSVNIIFNYPGVGESKGSSYCKDVLVKSGIVQVQRLLDQGIPPSKIVLNGFSLGGAIATLVAEHFHQSGKNIYLFNSKSFDNTAEFVLYQVREIIQHKIADLSKQYKNSEDKFKHLPILFLQAGILFVLSPIVFTISAIADVLVRLSGWNINAGSAYNKIDEKYKDYIICQPEKKIRNLVEGDGIIPAGHSIHSSQRMIRHRKKQLIDELRKYVSSNERPKAELLFEQMRHENFHGNQEEKMSLIRLAIVNYRDGIIDVCLDKLKNLRDIYKYEHKFYMSKNPDGQNVFGDHISHSKVTGHIELNNSLYQRHSQDSYHVPAPHTNEKMTATEYYQKFVSKVKHPSTIQIPSLGEGAF